MILWIVMVVAVAISAGCGESAPVKVPSEQELRQLCPAAFEAATVKCGEIAVKHCQGYETLDECPAGETARAECRELRQKELARCR